MNMRKIIALAVAVLVGCSSVFAAMPACIQFAGASSSVELPAGQEALHRHIKEAMPLSVC